MLGYIHNDDKRYHTFVANRLSFIHDGSIPDQWKHVDGKSNPADIASRGSSANKLLKDTTWLRGPDFLWKSKQMWPTQPDVKKNISLDDPEIKTTTVHHVNVNESSEILEKLFRRFSSWYKLKKATAWILRYKNWLLFRAIQRIKPDVSQNNKEGKNYTSRNGDR